MFYLHSTDLKSAGVVPGGGVEGVLEGHGGLGWLLDGQLDQVLLLQEVDNHNHQHCNYIGKFNTQVVDKMPCTPVLNCTVLYRTDLSI